MQAIVLEKYGPPDVLHLAEVPKPAPADDEVLLKVHAASVNALDWHIMRGDPFVFRLALGLLKPKFKILGADVAGRVEAVGRNVKAFSPGDDVFGDIFPSGLGAFAEYVCARASGLVLKPAKLTYEQAAAVPLAAVTALQGLRDKGKIRPGHKVLIHGAAGGVGMFAVQIAKAFGAEVTGLCSTGNVDMVRSLGADHVIDHTREDFTRNGRKYDLILAVGGYRSLLEYRRALTPQGTYVLAGGTTAQFSEALLFGPLVSMISSRKMRNISLKQNPADLATVKALLESGKITPIIDRRYPLREVAEAIRYLEGGHARGKVVIVV